MTQTMGGIETDRTLGVEVMANATPGDSENGDGAFVEMARHRSRVAQDGVGYDQQFNEVHAALFGQAVASTRIGRFTVLEKLGQGAMGVVFGAYDPELDRKVAIKLVREDVVLSDERRARQRREAQAMGKLSHPNVVQVFEVGEHEGQLFVAMEFVRGQTLGAWLKGGAADTDGERKGRSWQEVVEVFLAAARGLAAAHKAGIIHRDFKPENVMVGSDGRVRVMDFGLARPGAREPGSGLSNVGLDATMVSGESSKLVHSLTRTGAVMGTPAYMSPEQFKGDRVDDRSDQFSLCVALYEGLYGQRPFAGGTWSELMMNVLDGRRREVPATAGVPTWLRNVVGRGLAVKAEERWPSIGTLIEALNDDPEARWRARRNVAGIVLVAVAVLVGLGRLAWNAEERAAAEANEKAVAQEQRDEALERLERQRDEALAARDESLRRADEVWVLQAWDALATDPTATLSWLRKLSDHADAWSGEAWLLAHGALSFTNPSKVVHAPGLSHDLHWGYFFSSPDGAWVSDGSLAVWGTETGESISFETADTEGYELHAISNDARTAVLMRRGGAHTAFALYSSTTGLRVLVDSAGYGSLWFSNDSQYVMGALTDRERFDGEGTRWRLGRWSTATGEGETLADIAVRAYYGTWLVFENGQKAVFLDPNRGMLDCLDLSQNTKVSIPAQHGWSEGFLRVAGDWILIALEPDSNKSRLRRHGTTFAWNPNTGATRSYDELAIATSGNVALLRNESDEYHAVDVETGTILWSAASSPWRGYVHEVLALDHFFLFSYYVDGSPTIEWTIRDSRSGGFHSTLRETATGMSAHPSNLFVLDRQRLANVVKDEELRVWRPSQESSATKVRLRGERASVSVPRESNRDWAEVSRTGAYALYFHGQRAREFWGNDNNKVQRASQLHRFDRHNKRLVHLSGADLSQGITTFDVNDRGRVLIGLAKAQDSLQLWGQQANQPRVLSMAGTPMLAVLAPDGDAFAAASDHGDVYLWSKLNAVPHVQRGQGEQVRWLEFSPDGRYLAIVRDQVGVDLMTSLDGSVRELVRANLALEPGTHDRKSQPLVLTNDRLALVRSDGAIEVHSLDGDGMPEYQQSLGKKLSGVRVQFAREGEVVLVAAGRMIALWDVVSSEFRTWKTDIFSPELAISRDGRFFLTLQSTSIAGMDPEGILLWDSQTGRTTRLGLRVCGTEWQNIWNDYNPRIAISDDLSLVGVLCEDQLTTHTFAEPPQDREGLQRWLAEHAPLNQRSP